MGRGGNTARGQTVASRSPAATGDLPDVPADSFDSGTAGDRTTPVDRGWYVEYLRQQVIAASIYKTGTMNQLQRQTDAVAQAWRQGASEAELIDLSGLTSSEIRECVHEDAYEQGRLDALDTMHDDY